MEKSYINGFKLMLLGLTGAGKSRLGNKLSGINEYFKESPDGESCTKEIKKCLNHYVQIIDTPGFGDTKKEDEKQNLTKIFNEIKESEPNVLAYVQKANEKRFLDISREAIEKICEMFNTKSIWNHFIIIFTFSVTISEKKRKACADTFIEKNFLKVIKNYYENHKVNDNLPTPQRLKYYFVELNDDDDKKLDDDTVSTLADILKYVVCNPPINDKISKKIIVDIQTKKNCQKSIKKHDRLIKDPNGTIKSISAKVGGTVGTLAAGTGGFFGSGMSLAALGVATGAPCTIPALIVGGIVFYFVGDKLHDKITKTDFEHQIDENFQLEDYEVFDEETYIYNDGTSEVKHVNVNLLQRIIAK